MVALVGPTKKEKRDLEFRFQLDSLLAGDFTQLAVEKYADRLLRGLLAAREQDAPVSRCRLAGSSDLTNPLEQKTQRTIMFVAYGLGALIVHMVSSRSIRTRAAFGC